MTSNSNPDRDAARAAAQEAVAAAREAVAAAHKALRALGDGYRAHRRAQQTAHTPKEHL